MPQTQGVKGFVYAQFRFYFMGFISANSEKTKMETWNREAVQGKPRHDGADRDEKETPWKANDRLGVIWRSRGNKERRIGEYTIQYPIPLINISIITGKSRGVP
jgi:hypothetical protein